MQSPLPSPPPLPWPWFDFTQPPQPIPTTPLPTIHQNGSQLVYHLPVEGRQIPFKFLRLPPQNPNTPRPTLVLLHGMGLNIATFRGIAPHLLPTHDLLLIDYSLLSTQSRAGWPSGGLHPFHLANSVWPIVDALHIPRISLLGNSLGGGLSLLTTLAQPNRVDKILLTNPACYPQVLPRMYRLARIPLLGELLMTLTNPAKLITGIEFIGYVDKSQFTPELRSRYHSNMATRKNRFRLMDLIRQLPADHNDLSSSHHLSRLNEITHPVLIVWGAKDPLLVPNAGQRLAKDLPNATFAEFPNLAHMPHEESPNLIGPLLADFLNTAW